MHVFEILQGKHDPPLASSRFGHLGSATDYQDCIKRPDPNDRSDFRPAIWMSAVALMTCSAVAVMFRLVRSWQKLHRLETHDVYIILAVICALVMSAGCAHLTKRGLGQHDYEGDIAADATFQQTVIMINCFYFSCNLFVKLGLLQMYRAFTREHWGTVMIYSMETASILFWLGSFLATVLECVPLSAVWDYTITHGWCINMVQFYHANASIMICMDCLLYLIPIIFTWNLRLSRQKRIGVTILFGLGFIVVGASCFRLWVIHQIIHNGDMSFNYGRSLFASAIENHTAIIIACAPAMRSVVGRGLYPKVRNAVHSSRGKFGKLWSSSGSAPQSPLVEWFQFHSPEHSSTGASKVSKSSTGARPLSTSHLDSKPVTQTRVSHDTMEDSDIELGFHDTTCDFVPAITTTISTGSLPKRPPSTKNKIYITKEITVTEEYVTPPLTPETNQDGELWRSSTASVQSIYSTGVSSVDVASLPIPKAEHFQDETENLGVVKCTELTKSETA